MTSFPPWYFLDRGRGGDDSFVYVETVAGGAGARSDCDGMDGIQVHMTNTSNLPIEALENEYDLRVVEYGFIPDSGGAGQYRGGLGLAREIMALEEGIVFTARSDGHIEGAPGVYGGQTGRPASLIRTDAKGKRTTLSSKVAQLSLNIGDTVRLETPGGGGYGNVKISQTRTA